MVIDDFHFSFVTGFKGAVEQMDQYLEEQARIRGETSVGAIQTTDKWVFNNSGTLKFKVSRTEANENTRQMKTDGTNRAVQ